MPARSGPGAAIGWLLQLALLGMAVGVACWPFNWLDGAQATLLQRLPAFTGLTWTWEGYLLAASPLLVMPLLLLLQARAWRPGAGSGIPQTMTCLEEPERADQLMAAKPTLQRLGLWGLATLSLMPLGREGPVVQMGAAVFWTLRSRFPQLLGRLELRDGLTVAAGAGLAAGFNTPLMAVVFIAEELSGRFVPGLIWPALVVCGLAAQVSSLGGQPEFALGVLHTDTGELGQLLAAVPISLVAGLLGAGFGRLVLEATRRLTPLARRYPLRLGLGLGMALALLALLSGGASGGDGEALMGTLISDPAALAHGGTILLSRLLGPCLALGAGVPGGLIDPAFTIGALVGDLLGTPLGLGGAGLALGMTAALAGATQLPALSLTFALRLAGDQQLLPGMLLAAALGAYLGRVLLNKPIYHALTDLMQDPANVDSVSTRARGA